MIKLILLALLTLAVLMSEASAQLRRFREAHRQRDERQQRNNHVL